MCQSMTRAASSACSTQRNVCKCVTMCKNIFATLGYFSKYNPANNVKFVCLIQTRFRPHTWNLRLYEKLDPKSDISLNELETSFFLKIESLNTQIYHCEYILLCTVKNECKINSCTCTTFSQLFQVWEFLIWKEGIIFVLLVWCIILHLLSR